MSGTRPEQETREWIVLGSSQHGVSFGPFTRAEALSFEGGRPGYMALPWDSACSQIETCVKYGLPFKPRRVSGASSAGSGGHTT